MTSWLGPQGASGRIVAGILGNPEAGGPVTGGLIKLAQILLVPFVSVLAALVLTMFALFRGVSGLIPIAAVRESAILKTFDTFLTGWFGDIRILLYDPAQSANIRGGLARAVRALRAQGCGRMVDRGPLRWRHGQLPDPDRSRSRRCPGRQAHHVR